MSLSKYYYDSKTCRYEPIRTSFPKLAGFAILFSVSTLLLFWGLLTVHSKLFLSDRGKALKKENITMVKHHASILDGLASAENVLEKLDNKNSDLHKKIFETPIPATQTTHKQEDILLTDEAGFKAVAKKLDHQSEAISKTSAQHNAHFSAIEVSEKDLQFFMSIPSIQPVANEDLTRLVSGFGKRINPFHKGNYDHSGVDFAATRGTSVMATAKGTVVDTKSGSDLQAGYGNYIEIDHGNGLITRYAHLEEVNVRVGQRVSKGFVIGTVGMSGGAVAPHVHYEIIREGKQVDPVPYFMEKLSSDEYAELLKLGSKKNQSLD